MDWTCTFASPLCLHRQVMGRPLPLLLRYKLNVLSLILSVLLFKYNKVTEVVDGFGGLVVSMLASCSRVRGFEPDRSRWIFSDVKKFSACLPSEGK
jgi:hypothetical protein